MARGRMLNSKIAMNKAINELSNDTSRLAFTWLVSFADVEGRTYGDPAVVRSMLFPRRTDVTTEMMATYIQEWDAAGLVTWYEAAGDYWIAFPKFDENQRGLDRRKEPKSEIPAPPGYVPSTEEVQPLDVPSTEQENRTEKNRTEGNASQQSSFAATAVRAYENTVGMVSGAQQAQEIDAMLAELEERKVTDWWGMALQIAADQNKRSWAYVRGTLNNCLREGRPPLNRGAPSTTGPPQKRVVKVRSEDGKVREELATL